ncbi:MAG TPA: 2-C-methyl-D-erythritol 4-phosphate cytidylyltransferase [Propionibacteriaceae bacterium]|jgi:2-C-methyl-D-erythritol 4-phosphate cytidylyltransferase|nr:2-C-methyl-D-erythritol 4-phosphate cytidylyltransferase [Propionibacteriaceae bacterium]
MAGLRNVAVVLAGGTGTRMGRSVPKQLIPLAGRPILEHSIAAMQRSPVVDEIVVVMTPGHLDLVPEIVARGGYDKVSQVVSGGTTRNDSTAAALAALGPEEANVLVHDAARPLVTEAILAANVTALGDHEAVITAIGSSDTVVEVDLDRNHLVEILPRPRLRRCQTPQSFRLSTLRAGYSAAARDPAFTATDDATVVLRYLPDVPIAVVPGDPENLKITEPLDLFLAEQLLRRRAASLFA